MEPEIKTKLDKLPILDPTDDNFDKRYIAFLKLMSTRAASATLNKKRLDHQANSVNVETDNPNTKLEKSHSISPEMIQAILLWDCDGESSHTSRGSKVKTSCVGVSNASFGLVSEGSERSSEETG